MSTPALNENTIRELIENLLPQYKGKQIDLAQIAQNSSIDIVTVAVTIEKTYGMRFELNDFGSPAFATISGLIGLINERKS